MAKTRVAGMQQGMAVGSMGVWNREGCKVAVPSENAARMKSADCKVIVAGLS